DAVLVDQATALYRHQAGEEKQVLALHRRSVSVECRRLWASDNFWLGLGVVGKRDRVDLDAQIVDAKAGLRGSDDRRGRRGLEIRQPDLVETWHVLAVDGIDLCLGHAGEAC